MESFVPTSSNNKFLLDWRKLLGEINSKRATDLRDQQQRESAKTQKKERRKNNENTNENTQASVSKQRKKKEIGKNEIMGAKTN